MDMTLIAVDVDGSLANPVMQVVVAVWSLLLTVAVVGVLRASIPGKMRAGIVAAVAVFGFLAGPLFCRLAGMLMYSLFSKPGRSVGFFGGPPPLVAPAAAVLVGSLVHAVLISRRRRTAGVPESVGSSKPPPAESQPTVLRCSFCSKSQHRVKKLIAGPSVHICDECVDICLAILAESRKDAPSEPAQPLDPVGFVGYPARSSAYIVTSCSLCHLRIPLEHALPVYSRGLLCPGCIGAIEAAVAAARERGEPQ